eukprot:gene2833-3126_t
MSLATFVGGLGGLCFGYDIGAAFGAASLSPYSYPWPSSYQDYDWYLSNNPYCNALATPLVTARLLTLVVVGLALGILGALCAAWGSVRFGRRPVMAVGGLVYAIGASLAAAAASSTSRAGELAMLVVGRVFMGGGIGFIAQSTPLFLVEIAPAHVRAHFGSLFAVAAMLGLMLAQYVALVVDGMSVGWRICVGFGALPGLALAVFSVLGPDSPPSLAQRGMAQECEATLNELRSSATDAWTELRDLTDEAAIGWPQQSHQAPPGNRSNDHHHHRALPFALSAILGVANQLDLAYAIMLMELKAIPSWSAVTVSKWTDKALKLCQCFEELNLNNDKDLNKAMFRSALLVVVSNAIVFYALTYGRDTISTEPFFEQ